MRNRPLVLGLMFLALAGGVVLGVVLGGGGDDEDGGQAAATVTDAPPFSVTDEVDLSQEPDKPATVPTSQRAAVELAVIRYIEGADRGGGGQPGLPTTDELSFERTRIRGRHATVILVGGTRLTLDKTGGRWHVRAVVRSIPEPTPPSGAP